MKRYWTVVYYLLKDQDTPVTEHFSTRKDARRFKKALRVAPKFYKKVSLHKSVLTEKGTLVVSFVKEY